MARMPPHSPVKRRVALILPGFQSDQADWCIPAITNLVRELAAQPGLAVDVFALRYPHRHDEYRVNGAVVHSFGGGAVAGRRVWAASMALLWRQFMTSIAAEHARRPFALVHGFWATESGYLAVRAARRLGVPSLVHLAGGELVHLPQVGYGNRREKLAGTLVRRAIAGATVLSAPSGPILESLAVQFPAALQKTLAWSLGVDLALFKPGVAPQRSPQIALRLAHAASLVPVKDQRTLLVGLAAARGISPGTRIELSLAGAGPLLADLQRLAAELEIADRVHFMGELPHDALPDFYRAHDAFALASRHEAQCMAALEAMACGLPVISTAVGALADAEITCGWNFARRDSAGLAEALLEAAHKPALRQERGQAALRWVREGFALDTVVGQLQGIYDALVTGGAV